MTKIQHAGVAMHLLFRNATDQFARFSLCFETTRTRTSGTRYPDANQRPVQPHLPLLPL
jgi:hypothetical protein